MKKIIGYSLLPLLAIGAFLFSSFRSEAPEGGEGFEIYLDGKVVMQRFHEELKTPKTLYLPANVNNQQLTVKYYHCGNPNANSKIIVKDQQNQLLKTLSLSKSNPGEAASCSVKELFDLSTVQQGNINIFYSSSGYPKVRFLVAIRQGGTEVAVR